MTRFSLTKRTGAALAIACLAAALPAAPSVSAELGATFEAGVAYSDNVGRLPANEVDETIPQIGTNLFFQQNTRRIAADARGSFTYYDYVDDVFDDEGVASFDGTVDLNLIEGRLSWLTQDNYGRSLFDPFQPARPENWETVNFLTTGPTLLLFRGSRNESGVDLRYSRLDYETRPFDNERKSARFWVGREIQRGRTLSLNASVENVEFRNNGLTPEFKHRSAFLRYEGELTRNTFRIDLGYTEQEVLQETRDGVSFALDWTRQISPRSNLSLSLARQFSDQGNIFRYEQNVSRDVDSIGDITENGSPFMFSSANIIWSLDTGRNAFYVRIGADKQEYETEVTEGREDQRVELSATRYISRRLFANIDLTYRTRNFPAIDRSDDIRSGSVGLGFDLSQAFSLALRYSRIDSNSDSVTSNFQENRGYLGLTYTPAWAR